MKSVEKIWLPCWPVKVPHKVGGLAWARRSPAPGVITRLSPAAQFPLVASG